MTNSQASLNWNSLLNVPNDLLRGKVLIVTGCCCVGSSLPTVYNYPCNEINVTKSHACEKGKYKTYLQQLITVYISIYINFCCLLKIWGVYNVYYRPSAGYNTCIKWIGCYKRWSKKILNLNQEYLNIFSPWKDLTQYEAMNYQLSFTHDHLLLWMAIIFPQLIYFHA